MRIFGPKKGENEEWRRLHKGELHCLYCSPNIVRVIKSRRLSWAGHVARMEEGSSVFKIVSLQPAGKRPLGRPRRRWQENIKFDLREMGINTSNWVDLAQDRIFWRDLLNAVLNPSGPVKSWLIKIMLN